MNSWNRSIILVLLLLFLGPPLKLMGKTDPSIMTRPIIYNHLTTLHMLFLSERTEDLESEGVRTSLVQKKMLKDGKRFLVCFLVGISCFSFGPIPALGSGLCFPNKGSFAGPEAILSLPGDCDFTLSDKWF